MKFSGLLHDASGKPLSGAVDVTFALYNTEAGGSPLWFETQSVQADELGRYTALLGAMHTDGLPIDLFTSGEVRSLGIQVGLEVEQPRVLLVSVPYALKAGDAETLGGKPASAYMLSDVQNASTSSGTTVSATGTATTTGSGKNQLSRTANTSPLTIACASVTSIAGGAINSIPKYTAACNVENSVITQSGSNVGIGTTSPGSTLHLVGNNSTLTISGTGTHQVNIVGATSGRLGQDAVGFFFSSDTNGAPIRFATNNGAAHEWMRITSAGNVGLSTTTPAHKLDVAGDINALTTGSISAIVGTNSGIANDGVDGFATNATGAGAGVYGESDSNVGFGVFGYAGAASGTTYGVYGHAVSPNGIGVYGQGGAWAGYFVGDLYTSGTVNATLFSGTASNASALGGVPSGLFALLGPNTFTSTQTIGSGNLAISSGNLLLPTAADSTGGAVLMGGTAVLHTCCGLTGSLFVGKFAGNFTTTGAANVGVGQAALADITNGGNNVAVGQNALLVNTSGDFNTAVGDQSLSKNTSGNQNTAVGRYALTTVATIAGDTAVGAFALEKTTIDGNTAVGYHALQDDTTGSNNTALGYNAGVTATSANTNLTGSNNTFIGYQAGPGSTSQLSNATAIGYNAVVSSSNAMALGGLGFNAVSVGIGTDVPLTTLQVVGNIRVGTSGTNGCIQNFAGTALAGTCSSDARLKANITAFAPVLGRLARIRPVHFSWKSEEHPEYHFGPGVNSGLIAQEVEKSFPEMVATDEHGFKMVNYSELPYLMLQGIGELEAENEGLKEKVSNQQTEIAVLHQKMIALEEQQAEFAKLAMKIKNLQASTPEKRRPSNWPRVEKAHRGEPSGEPSRASTHAGGTGK